MSPKRTSGPLELVLTFVRHCARGETPICRRPQLGTMRNLSGTTLTLLVVASTIITA